MIYITYAYKAVIDYTWHGLSHTHTYKHTCAHIVSEGFSCDGRVLKVKGKYMEAAHSNSE